MNETNQFLINHGLPIIFAVVFLEQLGLPIPSLPWLLAAGALAATGKFHWMMGLDVTVVACLLADFVWFYLGRFQGTRVLGLLCRISLEPDSCVRRTLDVFSKYGWRGIVMAKFVPGMSTITPPLAGLSGVSAGRFLFLDAVGSALYCGAFIFLGYCFSDQVARIGAMLSHAGGSIVTVVVVALFLYIAYKFWQRHRLLHEIKMAKITVDELGQMLNTGANPFILDVRSTAELELDPAIIQGAVHVEREDMGKRSEEFPKDRDIVLYCACPNEVTSAKMALLLRRKGFARVRPLLGGIDAWRAGNLPVSVWTKTAATTTTTVVLDQEPSAANETTQETT